MLVGFERRQQWRYCKGQCCYWSLRDSSMNHSVEKSLLSILKVRMFLLNGVYRLPNTIEGFRNINKSRCCYDGGPFWRCWLPLKSVVWRKNLCEIRTALSICFPSATEMIVKCLLLISNFRFLELFSSFWSFYYGIACC